MKPDALMRATSLPFDALYLLALAAIGGAFYWTFDRRKQQ